MSRSSTLVFKYIHTVVNAAIFITTNRRKINKFSSNTVPCLEEHEELKDIPMPTLCISYETNLKW